MKFLSTKKIGLITLWSFLALVFLAAVGWYVYKIMQFKTYEDKQYQFSLKYPSNWTLKAGFSGTAVIFVRPKESALDVFEPNVNITVQEVPAQVATLAAFSELATKQMIAVFQKNINIIEDKDFNFAGRAGHRLVVDAPKPQNLKAIFVWTIKGSNAYIFTYFAQIPQHKELSPKIEEMIQSFVLN